MVMNIKIITRITLPILLFLSFTVHSKAQGWGFTATLSTSGPCGVNLPTLPTFTIPYMTTQGQCESLRQTILAINASQPMYDAENNYLGLCSVFYVCTPCSGADIEGSSGTEFGAGDVSVDGILQGKAFFSPHESKELENWMSDYIIRLNSMGLGVIDMSTFDMNNFPLTGNNLIDEYYIKQSMEFEQRTMADMKIPEPEAAPAPKPAGSEPLPALPKTDMPEPTIENEGIGTTVQLLTTSEQLAKQEQWMKDHGFTNPVSIGPDNTIDHEGGEQPVMSLKEAILREYVGDNIYGSFALKTIDGSMKTLMDGFNVLKNNDVAGAEELSNNIFSGSMVKNSVREIGEETITDAVSDAVTSPILGMVPGAGVVTGVITTTSSVRDTWYGRK